MERLPVSRLQSIDLLRGLAALAVVLIHIPHRVPAAGAAHDLSFWLLLPIDYGFLGVMMFIVLSGFCLHANALRETASQPPGRFAIDWPGFWRRRARRLYLPYLVVVLLGVFGVTAFYYVAGPRFSLVSQYFDEAGVPNGRLAADALLHASLLHNLVGGFETSLGNSPLWSLGMEAQLYVLFVVYIVLRRRVGLSGTVATVFLVSTVGWSWWSAWGPRTVGVGGATLGDWHFHPLKYWLAWVLGTLIAEAHAGRLVLPRWCARGVVGATLLLAYVATHGHVCTALFGEPRFEVLVTRALGLDGAPALALQAVLVPALRLLSPLGCFVLVNACVQSELAHGPCAALGSCSGRRRRVLVFALPGPHAADLDRRTRPAPRRSLRPDDRPAALRPVRADLPDRRLGLLSARREAVPGTAPKGEAGAGPGSCSRRHLMFDTITEQEGRADRGARGPR